MSNSKIFKLCEFFIRTCLIQNLAPFKILPHSKNNPPCHSVSCGTPCLAMPCHFVLLHSPCLAVSCWDGIGTCCVMPCQVLNLSCHAMSCLWQASGSRSVPFLAIFTPCSVPWRLGAMLDIPSVHSQKKGGGVRPPPQRGGGLRPPFRLCFPLCWLWTLGIS